MPAQQTPLIAQLFNGCIYLQGVPFKANDWVKALPGARFLGPKNGWRCDATPAAALKIMRPWFAVCQPDEAVKALAIEAAGGEAKAKLLGGLFSNATKEPPPKRNVSVTMSPKGRRFVIRGTKDRSEYAEFFESLPGARWHEREKCWTCEATMYAAHRILCGPFLTVEADNVVFATAQQWMVGQHAIAKIRIATDLPQPEKCRLPARPHQIPAYHFAFTLEAALISGWMGTGKSAIGAWLPLNKNEMRTLILCPTSVRGVWKRELEMHAGLVEGQHFRIIYGKNTTKKEAEKTDEFLKKCDRMKTQAIIIVNYEAASYAFKAAEDSPDARIKRQGADYLAQLFLTTRWDRVIADECHRLKSATSAVSLFASALRTTSEARLGLSGTPIPHSPLDLFGQYRFLDPAIFGTSYHRFRNTYAIENPNAPEQIVDWKNQDEFAEKAALIMHTIEANVLNLPPVSATVLDVELSPKARKVYEDLQDDMIAEVVDGRVVTAAQVLPRLIRLQQITSGFTVLDDDKETEVDIANDKENVLRDFLSDIPREEPVVVFCKFKHDMNMIKAVSEKLGRRFGELSGRCNDLTEHAKMRDDVDLMGVNIASGGVGIDLTRSRIAVFVSIGYLSPGSMDQVIARLSRPPATWPVATYHLVTRNTIDEQVYEALAERRDVIDVILSKMKELGA